MAEGSREYIVRNPATGQEIARYPVMTREEVGQVVAWAREKAPAWAASSFAERCKILRQAASLLAEDAERAAGVIAAETGKTKMDAVLADIFPVCDLLTYYAKHAENFLRPVRVRGTLFLPGRRAYYVFEPRGVVGVISPWNYPFTLSAGPAISALAAGNTVVLKPSSQTTGSGLLLKEIMDQAGLPAGVLQVLTGSGIVTGQALIEHPGLDMLFFTGSTAVGRGVNGEAAKRLIPAVMELGGKDSAIITRNADLDRAAAAVVWGAFFNAGQTCIGVESALVDRQVYEPFLERVLALTRKLSTGQDAGQIGSMTNAQQLKVVEDQVADALAKGARVLIGGKREGDVPGLYYPPTVLVDVTPEMKVMQEETFGPLLPVLPYDDLDQAVALANSTEYGLSGYIFTRDLEEGRRLARRIDAGGVNINDCLITYAIPSLPFGGNKHSGVGRYHGRVGLQAFTKIKAVTEYSGRRKRELFYYPLPAESEKLAASALPALFSLSPWHRIKAISRLALDALSLYRKMNKRRK